MVDHSIKKWMNLLEDVNPDEEIRAKLNQSYKLNEFIEIESENGVVTLVTGTLEARPGITEIVNVKVLEVTDSLMIQNTNLKNLINSPLKVGNAIFIKENQHLESLEGLPKRLGRQYDLKISNNPSLKSLKGIETDCRIGGLNLTYMPNLPMLRLLLAEFVLFILPGMGRNVDNEHEDLSNIINHHIGTYPNIKERIIKCQYAMIKAGYKGNAKW